MSDQLLSGSPDEALRNECQRLSERLQIAEQALEQVQKGGVDVGLQEVESLSPQDLLGQIATLRQSRDDKIEQVNVLTWGTATHTSSGEGVTGANSKGRRAIDGGPRCWSAS